MFFISLSLRQITFFTVFLMEFFLLLLHSIYSKTFSKLLPLGPGMSAVYLSYMEFFGFEFSFTTFFVYKRTSFAEQSIGVLGICLRLISCVECVYTSYRDHVGCL